MGDRPVSAPRDDGATPSTGDRELRLDAGGCEVATYTPLATHATPSHAVEVLGTLREAGAQHILINPAYDHMQQMDVLMNKVIPQL